MTLVFLLKFGGLTFKNRGHLGCRYVHPQFFFNKDTKNWWLWKCITGLQIWCHLEYIEYLFVVPLSLHGETCTTSFWELALAWFTGIRDHATRNLDIHHWCLANIYKHNIIWANIVYICICIRYIYIYIRLKDKYMAMKHIYTPSNIQNLIITRITQLSPNQSLDRPNLEIAFVRSQQRRLSPGETNPPKKMKI